ncbi:MAG TPA: flagellar hook-basal body complex protein [Alphaproteobacteria bacterium]|nr:flagellar hook-basal body complex protein [Alphaproteobacteria bacterium]
MGLTGIFDIGVNAMNGHSHAVRTISGNIANASTDSYKRVETQYLSLYTPGAGPTQPGGTAERPSPVAPRSQGSGIRTFDRYHLDQQGTVRQTGRELDLAIAGRGFFLTKPAEQTIQGGRVVRSFAEETLYGRDGAFSPDVQGTGANTSELLLRNKSGNYLMGWSAASGFGGEPEVIRVPLNRGVGAGAGEGTPDLPARATQTVRFGATLPTASGAGGAPVASRAPFFDATGASRSLDIAFQPVAGQIDTWRATVSLPGGSVGGAASATYEIAFHRQTARDANGAETAPFAGGIRSISPVVGGVVQPAGDGALNAPAAIALPLAFADGSAPGQTLSLQFGFFGGTDGNNPRAFDGNTSLTQFGAAFNEGRVTRDGYPAGFLDSTAFDGEGYLVGQYSNGENRRLYRLPIATFANENSLLPTGGNDFRLGAATGTAVLNQVGVDAAGADGRPSAELASLVVGGLEQSNVDIADEFSGLIVTQRAYTAASKILTTADQMSQTARDLKS